MDQMFIECCAGTRDTGPGTSFGRDVPQQRATKPTPGGQYTSLRKARVKRSTYLCASTVCSCLVLVGSATFTQVGPAVKGFSSEIPDVEMLKKPRETSESVKSAMTMEFTHPASPVKVANTIRVNGSPMSTGRSLRRETKGTHASCLHILDIGLLEVVVTAKDIARAGADCWRWMETVAVKKNGFESVLIYKRGTGPLMGIFYRGQIWIRDTMGISSTKCLFRAWYAQGAFTATLRWNRRPKIRAPDASFPTWHHHTSSLHSFVPTLILFQETSSTFGNPRWSFDRVDRSL